MVGVECALSIGMHRVFFSIKRVHWRWQKRAETLLCERDVWITPARFTMLRVLHVYKFGIQRGKLARLLGVAGPGVSRMLGALEAEGLVKRGRYDHDRRCVLVELTGAGRDVVERGLGSGSDVLEVDREAKRVFASSDHPDVDIELLDAFLIRARVRLEDETPFPVPWRGGELISEALEWYRLELPKPLSVVAA